MQTIFDLHPLILPALDDGSRSPAQSVQLLGRGMLCAVAPNLVFLLLFFRTSEFQYFLALAKRLLRRRAV